MEESSSRRRRKKGKIVRNGGLDIPGSEGGRGERKVGRGGARQEGELAFGNRWISPPPPEGQWARAALWGIRRGGGGGGPWSEGEGGGRLAGEENKEDDEER